ncbi:MAG TPA: hypothetical protein VKE69_12430 [Planctomycetota bacterium]|nr:hypothetical protein [Planctomycetota bacterium]
MATVRIVPGIASRSRLRALVVDTLAQPADVRILDAADAEVEATLSESASARLRVELGRRGVRVRALEATGLMPERTYRIIATSGPDVFERGVTTLPDDIGAKGLTLVVASCFYDGFRGAENYRTALSTPRGFPDPALKLLVGDNLYLDVRRAGEKSGDAYPETVTDYLRHFWSGPYVDVLEHLPTLTTFDDHEFWNDFPERQSWLSRSWDSARAEWTQAARDCIDAFQMPLNPPPIRPGSRSYVFEIPPVSFFVADTRTLRERYRDGRSRMLPDLDLAELARWASSLSGFGVFVLGQPL